MPQPSKFPEVLAELRSSGGLRAGTARRVFDEIFAGEWTPAQIAGLLIALQMRGETAEVLGAAASALRANMLTVEHAFPVIFDTCGTGGDGHGTINVSTGAALIVAAAGVPVAKHGNRAASSRSGSADVLSALGISLDVPPAAQARVLSEANIAFLFAPAHHPAMKHAGAPRRELGVRTIFNMLGPLANPARATHQLVGAFSDEVRHLMASALRDLGVSGAWVVHSEDGLDEISPYAPTRVTVVESGAVHERVVTPEDFGLSASPPGAIDGGGPEENATIIRQILAGEPHPARAALVLNAAASLALARGLSLTAAAALATETLDNGAALTTLRIWREASQREGGKALGSIPPAPPGAAQRGGA
jgi:anthranilate phosphoribosyltransferase